MLADEICKGISLKIGHRFIWILCVLLFGCEKPEEESQAMDFLDPQPVGVQNAKSFNRRYRGRYIDPDDSSSLDIYANRLVVTWKSKLFKFSRYDIDSSFTGDRSDNRQVEGALRMHEYFVDRFDGDTIYATLIHKDTIFGLSPNALLRHHKGSYFLNYTDNNIDWRVRRLDLKRDKLSISTIIPSDSLFAILPVQEKSIVKDDSGAVLAYKIRPSKKELKKLIKTQTFEEVQVWVKEK